MDPINLSITKKQKAFIDAPETEVLFGGAAGGGKSYGQVIDALIYALRYPGSRQLLLRRTYPELKMSILRMALSIYPSEIFTYSSQDHTGRFVNGSTIDFGYLNEENNVYRYMSAEFDVIRFDELTHFTEYMYTYLISRLRGANPYPKQIKSSTNPGNVGHGWVKERFITIAPPNTTVTTPQGTRRFIPSKVQDNLFLMQSDPEYVNRLKNLSESEQKALLYGSWDVFEGQYFTEWDRDRHVIEPFTIPKEWRRFRSMDWGFKDPCCVLWYAVGADGTVYVYRELYVQNVYSSDIADKIRELSAEEDCVYTAASPDMWRETGMADINGVTIAEVFANRGVPLIKADNTRVSGWQRVREYLRGSGENGAGKPRLQVFSTCVNLIRTLPVMTYDKHRVEDVGDGLEDHACESLRYGLMSRPWPNAEKTPKEKPPVVFDPLDTIHRKRRSAW